MSVPTKKFLTLLVLGLIYLIIAGMAYHFISRAGFGPIPSIAGSLVWPLLLFVFLGGLFN